MLLASFFKQFPQLTATELRHLHCQQHPKLPDGTYFFNEFYCPDLQCDCRKVSIIVMTPDSNIFATITYGWASPKHYYRWGLDKQSIKWLTKGCLDTLGTQSIYAKEFLNLFLAMLKKDPAYAKRLQNHYAMYKKSLLTSYH